MPQTVHCPQCKNAVAVRDEAAGKRVKCPKCGKEFLAPGFAPSKNDDDDWLVLDHEMPVAGSPAATPAAASPVNSKSSPPKPLPPKNTKPATGVPPLSADDQAVLAGYDADLDEFTSYVEPLPSAGAATDDVFDDLPPVSTSPPTSTSTSAPQAEDVEYESEYRVKCHVCGSILYAKATQQGKNIKCGDCYSSITVPPPPRKKTKLKLSIENAPTFQLEEKVRVERVDPFRKSAEELLEQAEKSEEEEPERTFDTPDIRQWALKVFGVFFDPTVLAHWIGLSMLAGFPAYFALWLQSPILLMGLFPGAILFSAVVVACGFAIMVSVANNHTSVTEWPTMDPIGWFEQLFVGFAAAGLAAFPAWAVGQIFFQPGLLAIALTMVSVYALFPFFLLSMMDMESVMVPFSPEVARSVSRCQEAWGGFYFSSGLLFFGLFLFYVSIAGSPPAGAAVVGICVTVAVAFMYFAMIGRLAYAIGQAVNDPPRIDEVDHSRPSEN